MVSETAFPVASAPSQPPLAKKMMKGTCTAMATTTIQIVACCCAVLSTVKFRPSVNFPVTLYSMAKTSLLEGCVSAPAARSENVTRPPWPWANLSAAWNQKTHAWSGGTLLASFFPACDMRRLVHIAEHTARVAHGRRLGHAKCFQPYACLCCNGVGLLQL